MFLSKIVSTSYSSFSSIISGKGGVCLTKLSVSLYGFNNDTWKTGWIFILCGNSTLYAVPEISSKILNGPTNLGVNFFVGLFLSVDVVKFFVDNRILSPTLYSICFLFSLAYWICLC